MTLCHLCADFYLQTAGMWIELYILVLMGYHQACARSITKYYLWYYFAEQRDILFIDVNVCLCLVWDEDRPRET